jgi:hypothetical protein
MEISHGVKLGERDDPATLTVPAERAEDAVADAALQAEEGRHPRPRA